jgi:beta-lactamase regulating signal transducer with metallopeptidase domain
MAVSPLITFTLLESPAATSAAAAANGIGRSGELIPSTKPASTGYHSLAIPAMTDRFATALEGAIPWLVMVWCLGVGLLSLRLLQGYWAVRSVRSREVRPMDPAWRERLAELQRRLRLSRPVLLFESALIQVPVVIGWLRPMILIPASSLSGLTPQQLELILAHELAHIRRHDHWVNLVQVLIETLLFYHPAVWWISHDIRAERELCCDDLAVATCGNRLAYARALTTLEGLRQRSAAMALGAGGGSLIDRVRHIVGRSASTVSDWRRPMGSALLGLGTLLFAAGVGCLALSPRQYVAVSRVALQHGDSAEDADLNPISGRPAGYDPYFIMTEMEKIRSPSVLYQVILELGLAMKWAKGAPMEPEEAVQQLKRMVDVRQVRYANLFEIFVYSDAAARPAEEGADIANKIAEVYTDSWATGRNGRRVIQALEQELQKQDEAVRQAQVRVDQLKQEYAISEYSVEGETSSLLEDARGRRLKPETMRWTEGYEQLIHLYNQLLELREKGGRELRNAILRANPDLELSKLMQELSATEASMAKVRVTSGVDHPEFRSLAAMQADLDEKVESRIQGIMAGLELRVRPFRSSLVRKEEMDAEKFEAEMWTLYRDYFVARRDLDNQQKIRDAILLRKLQETVNLQIPPVVQWEIVQRAEPSLRPVRARAGLGLGLCAAGVATGLCGLVVRGSARPPKL